MREVRKLTDSGHQTSIITTAYELELTAVSGRMFSRWCQENFFRYMKHHYGLDMLQEYGIEPLSDTQKVVNPDRRQQEGQRNSIQSKLNYRLSRFAAMELHPVIKKDETEDVKYKKWERKRAELLEDRYCQHDRLSGRNSNGRSANLTDNRLSDGKATITNAVCDRSRYITR